MVSINTNLSSLWVRQQLMTSTNSLNKAIERMTTGYKVNHASDNAANYSIIRNMDKDISAYDVAADNVAMGSDFAATANDALDLVNTHLQRIRDLLSQASNGTYGEQSRKAIQAEVDSRLAEINRIFKSTEYNGIQLFNNGILPSTLNINISELNLAAGSFDVEVDGSSYTVNLTNDDSLYSIISKLNAIGVDADFNEDSGIFTVEIDPNKITDNGTGFVSVLGLGYTDGYRAENLKTNEVYTVLESANADTRLSDVGVTDGSFTIIDSEGNETEDAISVDATISELFNKLWTHQISGSINSNGVVTFSSTSGSRISGALAEQIGIDVDIVDTMYQGLTVNTTNTLTHNFISNANSNTTLDKLGVQAGETLVVKDNEGVDLYTYTADAASIQNTTLGELFNNLVESGYLSSANVNNGVVSLSSDVNNYVTGTIANRFGIKVVENDNSSTAGITQTSSTAVTYNESVYANGDATLAQLGIAAGETFIINSNSGEELYRFTADNISIQNTTIGDFLNDLVSEGYLTTANITNGVISLSSDINNYATGTMAAKLQIGVEETNIAETILYDQTSSEVVTYTNYQNITSDTLLSELGLAVGDRLIAKNTAGEAVCTVTLDQNMLDTMSIGSLLHSFVDFGYMSGASVDNGVISAFSAYNNYLTGEVADKLGLGTEQQTVYSTSALNQTSSSKITYTKTGPVEEGITLRNLGIQDGESIYIRNNSGSVVYSYTANEYNLDSTLGEFLSNMVNTGYLSSATLSNGVISLSSNANNYVTGEIADRFNIGINAIERTETSAVTTSSASEVVYNSVGHPNLNNTFADLNIDTTSGEIKVYDENGVYKGNFTVNSSTTLGEFLNNINTSYELSWASMTNGIISISNGYITGSVADQLSMEHYENNGRYNSSVSSELTCPGQFTLSYSTTLGDLGLSNATITKADNSVVTLDSDDYIYSKFAETGVTVDITDGIITLNGGIDRYIKDVSSDLATALKIQVGEGHSYTKATNTYYENSDSSQIVLTGTYKISRTTTLGDLGLESASFTLNDDTVINISSSDSVYSKLQNAGLWVSLEDGDMTISGYDYLYLKDMSSNLANRLNINVGNGHTYNISSDTFTVNTPTQTINVNTTSTLNNATTLADLGLESASFTMDDNSVISIGSSDSIYTKLTSAGLNVSVEDGVMTISENNGHYLKDMSSNLAQALKLQAGEGHTYHINTSTLHTNTDSEVQNITSTYTLTSTTTLGELGLNSASFTMGDNTTVTINSTDSVYSKLQSAGLDVRIGLDGKIEITGDNNTFLKDMSSNLVDILHIKTGEGQTYETSHSVIHSNSKSNTQTYRSTATLTSANSSTYRMSDWGMSTNSKIYTNNVAISINRTDTISSLISKLSEAGIQASVNDENGTLKIVNSNNNYIISIDSSLKNALGIEVGEGHTYASHTETHRSATTSRILQENIKHTISHDATETTLLKDFNTDDLNIEGDLVFDIAGAQKVVKITAKDTISSLIDKLKDIGIKAIFKDQAFSISGNKNNVLLLDNSSSTTSYLADLLGLQYKDQLEGLTSSDDLNALADSIYESKFNTPQFLCIQAGISGKEHDMISMDMSLALGRVTFKTSDSASASKGLDKIDEIIAKVAAKQTEYGAFANRMESAADSINIALQNLVSSKSTLQDADIAVESSNYIKAQILQQAAATLLATANQMPAIAIQLL